jgi:hypothetical protein
MNCSVIYAALLTGLLITPSTALAKEPETQDGKSAERMHGKWEYVLVKQGTKLQLPSKEAVAAHVTISEGKFARTVVGIPITLRYTVDVSRTPYEIDLVGFDDGEMKTVRGVFSVRHNVMLLKTAKDHRPKNIDFDPDEEGIEYAVLSRVSE